MRIGLALAALVAIAAPGAFLQDRLAFPLTPIGVLLAVGTVTLWVAFPPPSRPAVRWLCLGFALVVALKLGLGFATPAVGLTASYWAAAQPTGAPEHSTEFGWLSGATRIDRSLDFRGNSFPVHFFNDGIRFNFWGDETPARDELPFFVRWEGYISVPSDGPHRFRLETRGGAHVWLDGTEILSLEPSDGVQAAEAAPHLTSGFHALLVNYVRPDRRAPLLLLAWETDPGGALRPVGLPFVYREAQPLALEREAVVAFLTPAVDASVVALVALWLALSLLRLRGQPRRAWARAALALIPVIFLVYGMALHEPVAGDATILSGGDDWLAYYESPAREITLRGPLLAGQGPFFTQPLYQYALALAHFLTGEGLFGPLALQFAGTGVVLAAIAALGTRLFGWRGGLAGLALFWAVLRPEQLKLAQLLLSENLYLPLVMASLLVLVGLAAQRRPPEWWQALLAGALLGLTALARSQFLLFVPLALLLLLLAWRRGKTSWWRSVLVLALMLMGMGAAIAPATARNWIVSKQFVLISSSAGTNLLYKHEPPQGFDLSTIDRDPLYEALKLDQSTRTIAEYARRDPLGYLSTWVPPAAYAVGIQGLRRGSVSIYWGVFSVFLLYLVAFLLPATRRHDTWVVHAFVLSHLLVMAVFASDTYGYRLVLPMLAPMAAIAAQIPLTLLQWLAGRLQPVWQNGPRWLPAAAAGLLAAGAFAQQSVDLAEDWPRREPEFHGFGRALAGTVQSMDTLGADVAYVASWDGTPRRFSGANLPGLRYPHLKWFDPSRSLPIPAAGVRAAYLLHEVADPQHDQRGLTTCLGTPDADHKVIVDAAVATKRCLESAGPWQQIGARFGDVAEVEAVRVAPVAEVGGQVEARLAWRTLGQPREAYQVFIHLQDVDSPNDSTSWGNGTAVLYAPSEWETGEHLLSTLPIPINPTAAPGRYRLSLGFSRATGNLASLTATWPGGSSDRIPIGTVELKPRATAANNDVALPADVRLLNTSVVAGGLKLLGVKEPTSSARPGSRITLTLLWRVVEEQPSAASLRLKLTAGDGRVLQEAIAPILNGKSPPDRLPLGTVVSDEHTLVLGPHAPDGSLALLGDILDASGRALLTLPCDSPLTTIRVEGRQRVFDPPSDIGTHQQASFGGKVELLGYDLQPRTIRPGQEVRLRLWWRALGQMENAYKIFTHVLDPSLQRVLAQQDKEPLDGAAPTTSWMPGEIIRDEFRLAVPDHTPTGQYPVEIGFYDARTGQRLVLPDGQTRVILKTQEQVSAE